jgi:hypothetical protein
MMMGALKPFFRKILAAIYIRQSDVHNHQVDLAILGRLHAFGAAVGRNRVKLLVQRQLFDQRLTQFGIVIDNKDGPFIGHRTKTS